LDITRPDFKGFFVSMKKSFYQPLIAFGLTLSGWIAGPVILAIFIGNSLDERFSTKPWLLLTCLLFAFIISNVGIVLEGKKLIQKIEKENNSNINKHKE